MQSNKICPNCGKDLDRSSNPKFCYFCGSPLPEPEVSLEVQRIEFAVEDELYEDKRYDFDLLLDMSGIFVLGITLPQSEYERLSAENGSIELPDLYEENIESYRNIFEGALSLALNTLSKEGVAYESIPLAPEKLLERMTEALKRTCGDITYIPVGIEFKAFYPDERSAAEMARFYREHRSVSPVR